LLGWNEWGVRLPYALVFTATIMLIFVIARRITPDSPWLPPLIYATFLFPYCAANIVTTDTLLTLWETLAVLGFVESWHHRGPGRSPFLLIMWGGFGLAFLTKGPPGLLPLLAITVFVLLTEGWKKIPRLLSINGIILFILVGLGWYMMVAIAHPGLMTYFIRDEFVNRIGSGVHHRNPQWFKPFVLYIPVLIFGALPWILSLFRKIRYFLLAMLSRQWWRDKLANDKWPVFLLLWFCLPLAVFFLSSSRLPLYILPLFVPLSLIIGRVTLFDFKNSVVPYLLLVWVIVLVSLKFVGSVYPYDKDSREMAKAVQSAVHPAPQEIVFIDTEPFWGLSLYLHCEVERVASSDRNSARTSSDELLSSELLENESGRKLFIIDKRKTEPLHTVCRKLGYDARTLGEYGSWIFIVPEKAFRKTS